MPSNIGPSGPELTNYFRNQIELHPEKYGVMGSYSTEMLEAMRSEDYSFIFDQIAYKLTTSVLCGQTVSETPRVELELPSSWFQHLKKAVSTWADEWRRYNVPTRKGVIRFLWVPFALALLLGKFLDKHPVRWTKVTADIVFQQRVLYPEIDAPAQMGRPVIYEDLSISWPEAQPPFGGSFQYDLSRFLNRHEVASKVMTDPVLNSYPGDFSSPHTTLNWLERHGVNVDQLVKRDA